MVTILGPLTSCGAYLPLYYYRVPAGFPSPAADHLEQKILLDEPLDLRAPHMYLVRIEGDSMTGAGIFCGDIAIVNRALEAEPAILSSPSTRNRCVNAWPKSMARSS